MAVLAICARIALPALLAFVVMTATERLVGTSPVRSPVHPTSIVWANRIFATRSDLERWLHARGASYETWASAHPALAATQSSPNSSSLAGPPRQSHVKSEDPTHLIALVVAVGVALFLALVLFYQRRLYDFRGSLQRSPPAVAAASARPRRHVDVPAIDVLGREAALSLRTRVVQPAAAAAKAIAYGAGPAALAVVRSSARRRRWLRQFRREHPDITWVVGASMFAAAVGFAIPYIIR
jgi:hypothetical protein